MSKFFSCEISFICLLKCPYSCFFPFLFSRDSCCIDDCVVCFVSGGCYLASSEFFLCSLLGVISINRYYANKFYFSFSFWHIQSINIISGMHRHEFPCSLLHLYKFFPCPLQEWSRVSYERESSDIYPLGEISVMQFDFEQFSCSSEVFFFFHLRLFNCVRFQYFQVFVGFLFSERSDFFSIW